MVEEHVLTSWLDNWTTDCITGFAMNWKSQICKLNLSAGEIPPRVQPASCPARQRIVEAFSLLEGIQLDRACRRDPLFGRLVEDRIVWRELIELELQEIDQQIERISDAAGDKPQP